MRTIIVGAGKVGYYLTKALREDDYSVTIIESDKQAGQFIANSLDVPVVKGDGTSKRVLEMAGVADCDALIAVTGCDEVNLISCQIAKKVFNVPKTVAKVNNPKNAESLRMLGVDTVVSSTDTIIKTFEREVDNSRIKELIPLNDGKAAVFELTIPENYVYSGKELSDIRLPDNCNIVSITRGDSFIIPRGKTKVMSNDVLLIVTAASAANEVRRTFKIKNNT